MQIGTIFRVTTDSEVFSFFSFLSLENEAEFSLMSKVDDKSGVGGKKVVIMYSLNLTDQPTRTTI